MGAGPCRAGRTAIVFSGGDPPAADVRELLPADAYVIAADSGLDHATTWCVAVDHVVGDFDSVKPATLADAEAGGARVERHPTAKDATDLELALDAAHSVADRIVVVGGSAGRLDHLLGTALLLGRAAYADSVVTAHLGPATLRVVRTAATLAGVPGELLSLLPLHGPAHGVVTSGLRFPLRAETLHPGSSRGISNEFIEPHAEVRLTSGVLLAVQPGPEMPTPQPFHPQLEES
ncbi:MAG TPA: thiamine diphosphokinase [Mycobacteriales bacterium]|jgi:thiamine pyrophosphokinase|nr:thiamine diphosphokinase [Mycobacteriales bacterium]